MTMARVMCRNLRRRYFRRLIPGILGIFFILFIIRNIFFREEDELTRLGRIYQAVQTLKEEHILEDSKNFTLYQAVRYFTQNHNLTEKDVLNRGFIKLDAVKLALGVMEGHRFDIKLNEIEKALDILQTRTFPVKQRQERCQNCNDFSQKIIINPEEVCKGNEGIDLLILITTVPGSVNERSLVRSTWGSYTEGNSGRVRYVFLYGTGWTLKEEKIIIREHLHFKDILQYDYKDTYYNLPYKVMAGYNWALDKCQRAKFILRTADDNYINIPALLSWITENSANPKYQRGQIGHVLSAEDRAVYRLRDQKYYISHEEYQNDVFPPFSVGTGFMYSMSSAEEIVKAAPNIPMFPLEDVWFGLIMEQIKMAVYDLEGFDLPLKSDVFVRKEFARGYCPYNGRFFTAHEAGADDIQNLWRRCRLREI